MHDLNLKPIDIRCKDDLKKMPIITKDDIRTNFDDFKSLDFTSRKIKMESTGGTSGDPLRHYYDFDLWSMDWACCYRGWGWRGYRLGDKMTMIGGSSIVPNPTLTV